MANELFLFTDGSVNTTTNVGFGAFMVLNKDELLATDSKPEINLKRFEETSSVKLELQTLLSALTEIKEFKGKITIYTDSQNCVGLPGRRVRLEKNNYYSKGGRRINNFELYKQFYTLMDDMNFEFVKIKGHKRTGLKNNIDRLFTLVDRASRNAVRAENGL
ncbi:MAG: hypothetical protein JXR61_04715 [Prolixibacteraceae bacterium]|nr:hypothetical protein [Prolixibacteraceae bacterium]